MVIHTQAIRQQQPVNYLTVFDHFCGASAQRVKIFITTLQRKNVEKLAHPQICNHKEHRMCCLFAKNTYRS